MSENKRMYGLCRGCDRLVPRDDMISSNVHIYASGVDVTERRIRIRLCGVCYNTELARWEELDWQTRMWSEADIRNDRELADKCPDIEYAGD